MWFGGVYVASENIPVCRTLVSWRGFLRVALWEHLVGGGCDGCRRLCRRCAKSAARLASRCARQRRAAPGAEGGICRVLLGPSSVVWQVCDDEHLLLRVTAGCYCCLFRLHPRMCRDMGECGAYQG